MCRHQRARIRLLRFVYRFIWDDDVLFDRRVPNHLTVIELVKTGSILYRVRYSPLIHVRHFDIIELGLFSFELTKAITLALF